MWISGTFDAIVLNVVRFVRRRRWFLIYVKSANRLIRNPAFNCWRNVKINCAIRIANPCNVIFIVRSKLTVPFSSSSPAIEIVLDLCELWARKQWSHLNNCVVRFEWNLPMDACRISMYTIYSVETKSFNFLNYIICRNCWGPRTLCHWMESAGNVGCEKPMSLRKSQ